MVCDIVFAMRVTALKLSSEKCGVGTPVNVALVLCVCFNWFVTERMLKKQVEQ